MLTTSRIQMARKPASQKFVTEDYKLTNIELAPPKQGEVLCKARYISLDPYLSPMMQHWQGPQAQWQEGIIVGRFVGEVIESQHPDFRAGEWVAGDGLWQSYEVANGELLRKVEVDDNMPGSAYLGVLGSSGVTAWIGMNRVLDVKAGQTFTVSSAAGTVGAIAGQMAKQKGARVIGIAGGANKCAEVVDELGFDACVDHHQDISAQLVKLLGTDGIDAHFENVGAKTLDPVLGLMSELGKIAICGLISHYLNDDAICLKNFRALLYSGLCVQGFRVHDHLDAEELAYAELKPLVLSGAISLRETVTEGLENAPQAYINMLSGGGTGKHILHLND